MNRVRIIGIGSPFGDDRIGWEMIEAIAASGILERFPPDFVSACCCARPGGGLLSLFENVGTAIVIDAMMSGASAGTVRRLTQSELEQTRGLLSSHGISVAETVALGRILGLLPATLVFYGIEVQRPLPCATLHPESYAALPALLRNIALDLEQALAD